MRGTCVCRTLRTAHRQTEAFDSPEVSPDVHLLLETYFGYALGWATADSRGRRDTSPKALTLAFVWLLMPAAIRAP